MINYKLWYTNDNKLLSVGEMKMNNQYLSYPVILDFIR